ncbi:hypothetical protein [Anabaena sphaerica]|uniref:hypothetical protein n=1 Tax=Anabaena sphaerica TaxID=212446 RepID=UPI001F54C63F|nr:hypothetical protein [Anabaena sphaerica]
MADNRKMLNFRCPLEVLEAIDSIGKERYPANNDNGCDRSKTLLDIIQAGIAALTNGEVQVQVVQPSKTELDLEAIEELVKKLIAENSPVIQPRLTDDNTYVRRYELPQKIDDRIANAIEDGIIGEAISKSYAAMMGQFNNLLEELQVLKNNIPAAPVPSLQLPIPDDLMAENQILKSLLEYEGYDEIDFQELPLNRSQIIKYFDIQDILDGAEYSDEILRARGIKSKMDENIDHFAKFIDLSNTHHSYVVERFNRILIWLGFEPEKIKIIPTEDGKSREIWSVSAGELQECDRQTADPSPITNAQSPITNSQLPEAEEDLPVVKEKNSPNLDKPTIMLHDGSILVVSEKQEKILILLGLIPQTHNLLTSQFLSVICKEHLTTNKEELESLIGEKIDSKGSTIRKTAAILRGAGFTLSGSEGKGFKIIGVK